MNTGGVSGSGFRKREGKGEELEEKQKEEEPELWSNVQLITGGQSPNASRMLSRLVVEIHVYR